LAAKFWRIAKARGSKRAAVAVAHTILVIMYNMLKEGTNYREIARDTTAA